MNDEILWKLSRGLLTLTLNRPERRNALSTAFALDLADAVRKASLDQNVRAILITGAGGTFCVGGDVKGMADPNEPAPTFESKRALMRQTMAIAQTLHHMAKPVVAAVEGAAAGAGLSLALSADFRVVGENAKLTTAFAKIGVSGDYGGLFFLTKMVGAAKARELALLSPVITGRQAYEMGLATRVVPDADVQESALELARSLAEGPSVALGYLKQNINNAEDQTFDAYLEAESAFQCRCLQTEDYKEATTAFVQKRQPQFTGR